MEEVWKDIVGYEGLYQISNLGRIKSLKRMTISCKENGFAPRLQKEIIRKQNIGTRGYSQVNLSLNGRIKSARVHKLVANAFIENKLNATEINHIDGNKQNNEINNLEWSNRSDNMKHYWKICGILKNSV